LIDSFRVFNINAFNYLLYDLKNNLYLILLIICAVLTVMLNLKAHIDETAPDEQNVL
jgi:hypothetical protein